MGRQIWVAAAVLATVSVVVSGQPGFTIYKFSLSWQPSVCNAQAASSPCMVTPQAKFTIQGLWPQLQGDVLVSPYASNPTCTQATPASADDMVQAIQPIIQTKLNQAWPNLLPGKTNEGVWRNEWEKYGKCSQFPTEPLKYFENAAAIYSNDFTNVPKDAKITVGQEYRAIEVLDKLKKRYGKYPQIACNTDRLSGKLQLLEIRFCYKPKSRIPWDLDDCPVWLAGNCKSYDDEILLPVAPPPPPRRPPTNGEDTIMNYYFSDGIW